MHTQEREREKEGEGKKSPPMGHGHASIPSLPCLLPFKISGMYAHAPSMLLKPPCLGFEPCSWTHGTELS